MTDPYPVAVVMPGARSRDISANSGCSFGKAASFADTTKDIRLITPTGSLGDRYVGIRWLKEKLVGVRL